MRKHRAQISELKEEIRGRKAEISGYREGRPSDAQFQRGYTEEAFGGPGTGRGIGGTLGAGIGFAVGGPAGGALGGMLGYGLGSVVGTVVTRPELALRAYAGARATSMRALAAISDRTGAVGSRIRGAVRRFARGTKAAARGIPRAATIAAGKISARERHDQLREDIRLAATDPEYLDQRLGGLLLMREYAPKLAGLVTDKTRRGAQFLLDRAPPLYVPALGAESDALIDPVQLDRWLRYVDAVVDPVSTIDGLSAGTFTPEHAEALREVYPALYADVGRQVIDQLADDRARGVAWPHERGDDGGPVRRANA